MKGLGTVKTDDRIRGVLAAHLQLIQTGIGSAEEGRAMRRRDRLIKALGAAGRRRLAAMGRALTHLAGQKA